MDDVYPLFLQDDLKPIHNVLSWVMRFNDVLDAAKLHNSLCSVLRIDDWRYCAGRIRPNSDGKHEVHVPSNLDESTLVSFTHKLIDADIEKHQAASCIPQPSHFASVQALGNAVFDLAAERGTPVHIKQMIQTDRPMISLHVTTFFNATIVAISWPHTMTDVGGHVSLMQSWSLALAGNTDQLPPVLGARGDILDQIEAESSPAKRLIGDQAMGRRDKLRLGTRLLYKHLRQPPVEDKVMFLPKKSVDGIIAETRADLATHDPQAYITEGDILSAWAAKNYAKAYNYRRPVTVAQMLGIRGKIPQIAQAKGVYMQNMLQVAYILLPIDLLRGPLCHIALSHRKQFVEHSTEEQVRATLCQERNDIRQGKQPNMFFGPPDALILPINNLIKTNYFQIVDFNPAVMKQGEADATRQNPVGTMVTWFNKPLDWKPGWLELFYLQGRDHAGNMWMKGVFRPDVWRVFEAELKLLESH